MNLYEFQAKELLQQSGIGAPRGRVAGSPAEALGIARRLGFSRFAVKAQVHAGDRGPNGGVLFADTPEEVAGLAGRLIGRPLVTSQTAPSGELVRWILVEQAVSVRQLLYCAVAVDPARGRLLLLASNSGGAAIASPGSELIRRELRVGEANSPELFEDVARQLGLEPALAAEVASLFGRMAQAALSLDAPLVEINPLAITADGHLLALDAKMVIDDNALFRHRDLAALRDFETRDSGDTAAIGADLHQINYMKLDGDIGVVVNGAGLALATLDTLADAGGSAANFMDVRTTASSQDIAYGFRLVVANPTTRAILVNVHGGGMQRCDTVAEGIAIALVGTNRRLPLVVRFAGNNAEFAVTRLEGAGIGFHAARDMADAAEQAVRLAKLEAA